MAGLPALCRSASPALRSHAGGAAAVEFGLVAAPFLALTFAIMETAIVFFAGQALETAAPTRARLIMTGQAQTQGFSGAVQDGGLRQDLRPVRLRRTASMSTSRPTPTSPAITMTNPVDANGNFQTPTSAITPGGPGDIVVVRLFYQWPVYVSLLGFNLSNVTAASACWWRPPRSATSRMSNRGARVMTTLRRLSESARSEASRASPAISAACPPSSSPCCCR